jgi:undecaprenyl-diphosphatase
MFHIVNGWCGNWWLDRIAAFEERNYLFKGGLLVAAFCWFWFAADERRRAANRRTIVAVLIGTVLALSINRGMASLLPFRVRPMYLADIGYHAPSLNFPFNLEHWSSFPSDSATFWLALSFGLFRLSKPLGVVCMVYSTLWMCLVRLYLGIHYPSDLVAGGLLGVLVVWGVDALLAARDGAIGMVIMRRVTAMERRYPNWFYAAGFLVAFELTMVFDNVRSLLHVVRLGVGALASLETAQFWTAVAVAILVVACLMGWLLGAARRRAGTVEHAHRIGTGPAVPG